MADAQLKLKILAKSKIKLSICKNDSTTSTGNEVDLIVDSAAGLQPIEIKSGSTYAADWAKGLQKWQQFAKGEDYPSTPVDLRRHRKL